MKREAIRDRAGAGGDLGGVVQLLGAVHVVEPCLSPQGRVDAQAGIDDFDMVAGGIPVNVDRLAGRPRAPIRSGQVVVIVVGLPHKRWVGRLAHPDQDPGSARIDMVEPALVNGLHGFLVEKLGLAAVVPDIAGCAVAGINIAVIAVRSGISCRGTQEVLVPHFAARPPVGTGHELFQALEGCHRGCADFASHSVMTVVPSVRHGMKVLFQAQVMPRPAAAEIACMGVRLVAPVPAVIGKNICPQPVVERRGGVAFVLSAPERNTRMAADLLDLLNRIGPIHIHIRGQAAAGIEPELVPNHQAIAVAGIIKSLVGGHAHPIADHVEVHLLVETELRVIVLPVAAQHEFGHAPAAPLGKDTNAVDMEVQNAAIRVVGILADTEADRLGIGNRPADPKGQPAGVEAGSAVAIRPPEPRISDPKSGDCRAVQRHSRRLAGAESDRPRECDAAGLDHAGQYAGCRRGRRIGKRDLHRQVSLSAGRQVCSYPGVSEGNGACPAEINVFVDAHVQAGDARHPIPATTANERG